MRRLAGLVAIFLWAGPGCFSDTSLNTGGESGDDENSGDSAGATSGEGGSATESSAGDGDSSAGDGDGASTGDGTAGDGDGTAGDGDGTTGDGDGTTGDGDGTSGDGDGTTGDGTTGDGDGTTTGDGDGTTTGDGDGTTTGDGDGTTTGDGDGTTTGDGDGTATGDGDGTTTGDGDGTTTGDGDGTATGDGDGDGSTGDGDGTAGDGDGDGVACPGECIPPIPAGWSGPVLRWEDALTLPSPNCPSTHPATNAPGNIGLQAPDASCGCSCDPGQDITCDDGLLFPLGNDPLCTSIPLSWETVPADNSCVNIDDATDDFKMSETNVNGGSCAATPMETVPAAGWNQQVKLCGGAAVDDALCPGAEVCAAPSQAPFEAGQCIFQTGDVACPVFNAYANRIVHYGGFLDDRRCEGCACGSPGGTCGGSLAMYTVDDSCTVAGFPLGMPIDGSCWGTTANIRSVRWNPTIDVNCPVTDNGAPVGGVVEDLPITVCCL